MNSSSSAVDCRRLRLYFVWWAYDYLIVSLANCLEKNFLSRKSFCDGGPSPMQRRCKAKISALRFFVDVFQNLFGCEATKQLLQHCARSSDWKGMSQSFERCIFQQNSRLIYSSILAARMCHEAFSSSYKMGLRQPFTEGLGAMGKNQEIERTAARHAKSMAEATKIYAQYYAAWMKADKSKLDAFNDEDKCRIFGTILAVYQQLGGHGLTVSEFVTNAVQNMKFAEDGKATIKF